MFAQEIPDPHRLPTRVLTGSETDLWNKACFLVETLSDQIVMLKLLNLNAAASWWFANDKGIPFQKPAALELRLLELEKNVNRARELMRKVEDLDFALQFRDGDIDIVDPNQPEAPELGAIFLIIAGAVVLAGLIGALIYYKKEADEIRPRYNNLLAATDKVFCKDASPETCAEWKQYKQDAGYEKRKSLAEKIYDGLGKSVVKGTRWGLMIAIPLIALAFIYKNR